VADAGGFAHCRDNTSVDPRPRAGDPPPGGIEPILADADERRLVAAILRNDRKAAAQFVAAHIDAVYSYVRHRLTPRAELVDDVVQEVFLAALNGLAHFEGRSSLRTWLVGIARHKIEDVYRQRLRAPESLDEGDSDPPATSGAASIDTDLDRARDRARARRALARLPERYALILLWRYWEQRSTREIAAATDTTEKSVERMLARARARFREVWLQE
jgi:RNA polymerase sigma-70 factor (ECF subfamily)